MTVLTDESAVFLKSLAPANAALFLDFDGVLVDIAARPDDIRPADDLAPLLSRLERALDGALAVVSGRHLSDLRRYLPEAPATVICSHGAEGEIEGSGTFSHPLTGSRDVARLHKLAMEISKLKEGCLLELKPTGAVLHYRGAPDIEASLLRAARAVSDALPVFEIHRAKCAIELRPGDMSKRQAVIDLARMPLFADRVPIYFGDDRTDEPAMKWVIEQGGISVKVGPGDTCAQHRLDNPAEVSVGLKRWIDSAAVAR